VIKSGESPVIVNNIERSTYSAPDSPTRWLGGPLADRLDRAPVIIADDQPDPAETAFDE